jgi:hypothetical protein
VDLGFWDLGLIHELNSNPTIKSSFVNVIRQLRDLLHLLLDDLLLGDARSLGIGLDTGQRPSQQLTRAGAGNDNELEGIGRGALFDHGW